MPLILKKALGAELYNILDAQGIKYFKESLLTYEDISQLIGACEQVVDYFTEGVGWTPSQEMFHKVFIEFHSQLD